MSRVITPEVGKYLELESSIIQTEMKDYPVTLAVIDTTSLWLLMPDGFDARTGTCSLRLRIANKYIVLPISFERIIKKETHNLILYAYDPASLPEKTYEKVLALLSHTASVQKRKNERIELNRECEVKTGLRQTASLILLDEKHDCIIKDISLGGCQFVCFGKMFTVAAGVSSIALQLSFTKPDADFILPAKVIRKTVMETQRTFLSGCAVQFLEPTNIHFEKRLLCYFD